MELWIRSQNRESLVKVNNVFIYYEFEKQYVIQSQDNINISYRLGKYKTKKRALEVLDEIQNILLPKTILNFADIVKPDDMQRLKEAFYGNEPIILNKATIEHLENYVYEMPKE